MTAARLPCVLRATVLFFTTAFAGLGVTFGQAVTWDGTTSLAATALAGNTIGGGVTLTISTGNDHDYYGLAIVNNGTVNWTGGQLRSGASGSITNNKLWNDSASTNYLYIIGGDGPVFTNTVTGVYTKSGTGTTTFVDPVAFNNYGTVNVNVGTLQLHGGGINAPSGVINTASGATTLFTNNYTLAAGSSLAGLGTYELDAGTLSMSGTVKISTFNQVGGALGGTQTFAGTSHVNWTAGSWSTSGVTTIGANATLTTMSGNDHDFYGRAIVNNGTVNWTGGQLRSGAGGTITNNGKWNDTASSNLVYITGGDAPVFINAAGGVYAKSGAGTTLFPAPTAFNNAGRVDVTAGIFELGGGGTNSASGVFKTAAGAMTLFSNDYTVANGSLLTGAGTYQLGGGTLGMTGNIGVSTFNQTGGRLAGTQTFAGTTNVNWTGGDWNSSGTTTIGPSATLTIATGNDHDFYGRAIVNQGIVNWNAGQLRSGAGGTITNFGQWNDAASSNYVYITGGDPPVFTNAAGAIYTKSVGGTTGFGGISTFNNDGTVNINAGTFELNGGGTNSATGVINTAAGASTVFTNNYTIANGSALAGLGAYQLSAGTLTINGTVGITTFNQSGGRLGGSQTFGGISLVNWTAGDWNGAQTTTIGPTATLNIASGNDHDFYQRTIVNNGTVNWTGGQLRSGSDGIITNNGRWNDTASSSFVYITGGTPPVFTNSGTGIYTKSAAGTTLFAGLSQFNNDGAVFVATGTLELNGGGTNTGVIRTASTATTVFSNNYSLASGSILAGAGNYQLTGGTLAVDGSVRIDNLTQAGGALSGTHTFSSGSHLAWTSGSWNGFATTTLGVGAQLTINGANDHDFYGRAIVNNGTVNWTGGQLRSGSAGSITNNGLWNDSASSNFVYITGGDAPVFNNAAGGIYTKTVAGTTQFAGPTAFNNAGTIRVSAGTLAFTGGFSNSGTLTADGGNFTFTNPLNVGTGIIQGAGTFTAPTVTAAGLVRPGGAGQSGLLSIVGDLTLTGTSTAQFEIGGNLRGAKFDALDASGTTAVGGGTLDFSFINGGYAFVQGADVLTLLNAAAVSGGFGNVTSGARLSSTDGAASFQVNVTGSTVTLSNFALGALTYLWTGGNLNTIGDVTPTLLTSSTVPAGGHLAIYTGADHDFNATAIINNGTVDWVAGALRSGNSGSILNSGVWNDSATATFNNAYNGTVAVFTNSAAGTYNKTAGSTTFSVPFDNSGTVNVASGTLLLNAGGTISNGATYTGGGETRLNAGTFTASGTISSSSLVVTGGTLNGTYTLGSGQLTFTGGTLNGSALTIAAGAKVVHATSSDFDFNAGTLVNNGTFEWGAAAGALRSGNSGTFTNNALFADASSSQMNNAYNGTASQFINSASGTYSKTTNSSTTFAVPFTNSGTVTVEDGTLVLSAGGTINAGALFNGAGQTLLNSGTFTGNGLFTSVNLVLGGSATLAGTNSLGGTFTWASGDFNTATTSTIPVGATLNASSTTSGVHDFNSHVLVNNGTFNWSSGALRSGNSGAIVNNALFVDTASNTMNNAYNGTVSTFNNTATGTYRKTTSGTTTFGVPFNNAGTAEVLNGTLSLNAGGTITSGAVFTGAGQTLLNVGSFSTSGSFTSNNLVLGGSADLTGSSSILGKLVWTSGTFNNASTTTIPSGATLQIDGAVNHDFNSHTFANNGTVNWAAGALRSGNSGSIVNGVTGVFNDYAAGTIDNAYNGTIATFNNSGTYHKLTGGNTTFGITFNNAGVVDVVGGTLVLNAGGVISPGASFEGAGQTLLNVGTFSASGLFTSTNLVLGGSAMLTGSASLGGDFTWTSGTFNNANTTTIPAGSTLHIDGAVDHDYNSHSFSNLGLVAWTAGSLRSGNSGLFVNQPGGVFNDTASGTINNAYNGTVASFSNNGTYLKVAPGTTTFQIPFTNNGGIFVSSGLLQFSAGFSQLGGTLNVSDSAGLQFDSGLTVSGGTMSGNGTITGAVTNSGTISPSVDSAGTGVGTLTFSSTLGLTPTSLLVFDLGGINAGADFDRVNVSGAATLGGNLRVTFANSFELSVANSSTFTLLNASSITGAFVNVPNGQRLTTFDGLGSFLVSYGSGSPFAINSVVLSDFAAVPEPSTYVLFGLGVAGLFVLRRRHHSRAS